MNDQERVAFLERLHQEMKEILAFLGDENLWAALEDDNTKVCMLCNAHVEGWHAPLTHLPTCPLQRARDFQQD